MKKSDFHFDLPESLIAQQPLAERSASRMLVLPSGDAPVADRMIRELPEFLRAGDLLVFNDTRVLPARLFGRKDSGGQVEILLERVTGAHTAKAQLRASKSPRAGSFIELADGSRVEVEGRDGEFYLLRFPDSEPLEKLLIRLGRMPLPPYIRREDRSADELDEARYQTLFAREPGAVAAPTAGLHFDAALLAAIAAREVELGHVTLHVGAGTFQPMRAEKLEDHVMHREWLNVGAALCSQIRETRSRGGRVIAVGTTVVRALESALRDGEVQPFAGETQLFLFPGRPPRSIDALLTNFHLPQSTLLMLVCAFAGQQRTLAAYRHAVEQGYRFFSYGDAMLVYPDYAANEARA